MERTRHTAATSKFAYTEDIPDEEEEQVDDVEGPENNSARAGSFEDGDDDDFRDSDEEPVMKKTRRSSAEAGRKASSKGKGRAGRLECFQSMPLDVLCEIAAHLDPLTLLYLSRVSKSFRTLFLSKSSKSIWILARRNVFLPDLQAEDMSEAAYASLVFERNCHVCGKGRASIVAYSIRARYCKACQKQNLLYDTKLKNDLGGLHPKTLDCVSYTIVSQTGRTRSGRHYYFKPSVAAVNTTIIAMQQRIRLAQEAKDPGASASKKGKGKTEPAEAKSDEQAELDEFVRKRIETVVNARLDGAAITAWEKMSLLNRNKTNLDAKEKRREAIEAKLTALGHDPIDIPYYTPAFDQTTALSERIWSKISAMLIAMTEVNKNRRLLRERDRRGLVRQQLILPLYNEMYAAQPTPSGKDLFPPFLVFTAMESVKAFWEPEDIVLDRQDWLDSLDTVTDEVEQLKRKRKVAYFCNLANALDQAHTPLPLTLLEKATPRQLPIDSNATLRRRRDSLPLFAVATYASDIRPNRAAPSFLPPTITDAEMDPVFAAFTNQFICHGCSSVHPFPQILGHLRDEHSPVDWCTTWGASASSNLIAIIRRIVKATGLSEETVTDDDLEALGSVFECAGCTFKNSYSRWRQGASNLPRSEKLTWREVIDHALVHHRVSFKYAQTIPPQIQLMPKEVTVETEEAPVASTSGFPNVVGDDEKEVV